MKFGLHMSIAGGLPKSVERAVALGCDCFQLFVGNPRSWAARDVSDSEASGFICQLKKHNLGPVIVHMTYLPNLATCDPEKRKRALDAFFQEYASARKIKADYFVVHPGSWRDSDCDTGISLVADAIMEVFSRHDDGPMILLENMAGGGALLGKEPEELAAISAAVGNDDRVGVCFDTAHALAAGFDIVSAGGMAALRKRFRKAFGRHPIRVIHLNDLRSKPGSQRDRHEHIGQGALGVRGVKAVLATPGLSRLPVILETPVDENTDDAANLAEARRLSGKG